MEKTDKAMTMIDEMLESDDSTDVEDFLYSVRDFIQRKDFVSDAQYDGIVNCYDVYLSKQDD